uniref:ATP-dependent DNA helicase n=1 Tax=Tanacetum cinerariifolium TaxID=118510 RepID=A0A699GQG3_TANCI|nr:DNA helicase [Tanacetum cinerariifolium]
MSKTKRPVTSSTCLQQKGDPIDKVVETTIGLSVGNTISKSTPFTGDLLIECDKGGAAALQITRPNADIIDPYSLKMCDILTMGQCQRQKRKNGIATGQYESKRIKQLSKAQAKSLCSSNWDEAETTWILPEYNHLGQCTCVCRHCGAMFWECEKVASASHISQFGYNKCCYGGRIILRPPPEYPQYIKELYEDAHFIDNIRAYNQMFSMTSLGANIDKSINNGKGPYVFRISGQLYHWIGSLCPEEGQSPRLDYIRQKQDDIRSEYLSELPDPVIDPHTYAIISELMIHGPCGFANQTAACMKDGGTYNRNFPKPYCNKTYIDKERFVHYRRRDTEIQVQRQTLPVKKKASKLEILDASITSSYLWPKFKVYTLLENMRLHQLETTKVERIHIQNFSNWLLNVGNGTIGVPDETDPENTFAIHIPPELCISDSDAALVDLIEFIYDEKTLQALTPKDLQKKSNRLSKNEDADMINAEILALVNHQKHLYLNFDEAVPHGNDGGETKLLYPAEYLNSLNFAGFPPHRLELKVGALIILLQNINISGGLCNGTRLIVTQLLSKVIEARIITGIRISEKVFLPRIPLINRDLQLPFIFKRKQFPIKLSYAMTINKRQRQSLERIGVFLPQPVFAHGQLYVALSRATSPEDKGKLPLVEAKSISIADINPTLLNQTFEV